MRVRHNHWKKHKGSATTTDDPADETIAIAADSVAVVATPPPLLLLSTHPHNEFQNKTMQQIADSRQQTGDSRQQTGADSCVWGIVGNILGETLGHLGEPR